jgi:Spy/CpxP family protein refolding chaperone
MSAFMSKRMAERQAAFQHRADAIRRFYAVLSPEQKRAFDALHDRGGMGGHGGHGFEPHGGGPDDHRGGPEDHEHGEMG